MRGAIPLLAIPSYFRQISKRERVPALYGFQVRGLLKPKKPNNPPNNHAQRIKKQRVLQRPHNERLFYRVVEDMP